MTRQAYFEMGHVTARFGQARVPAFEDWFMRRQKQRRRVEVVAPSFLSIPGLLVGTRRIATLHRRMAKMVLKNTELAMREMPFEIPVIRQAVQWNIANNSDLALRWAVEQLRLASDDSAISSNVTSIKPAGSGVGTDAIDIEYRMGHNY